MRLCINGGTPLFLSSDLQPGAESVADTARVLSRYLTGLRSDLCAQRRERTCGLLLHSGHQRPHRPVAPCQVLADLQTIKEKKGKLSGLKLAFVGDGNNVCNSLMFGCAKVGIDIAVATPKGYEPDEEIVYLAKQDALKHGVTVEITNNPVEAVKDADVVVTDVWASMGQEAEKALRSGSLRRTRSMRSWFHARPDYIFLHCLPANRGEEVTEEVIDGPNSVVWDEAENRLHSQKALLALLL